jgi:hypothetical protein
MVDLIWLVTTVDNTEGPDSREISAVMISMTRNNLLSVPFCGSS